jgi:hypothetical protein
MYKEKSKGKGKMVKRVPKLIAWRVFVSLKINISTQRQGGGRRGEVINRPI